MGRPGGGSGSPHPLSGPGSHRRAHLFPTVVWKGPSHRPWTLRKAAPLLHAGARVVGAPGSLSPAPTSVAQGFTRSCPANVRKADSRRRSRSRYTGTQRRVAASTRSESRSGSVKTSMATATSCSGERGGGHVGGAQSCRDPRQKGAWHQGSGGSEGLASVVKLQGS